MSWLLSVVATTRDLAFLSRIWIFFLSIVLILVVVFPFLFFLNYSHCPLFLASQAIKSRHQIQRETGSTDFLGRLLRTLQPSYENSFGGSNLAAFVSHFCLQPSSVTCLSKDLDNLPLKCRKVLLEVAHYTVRSWW